MFISILYVNIANLKSVPIEIFAEILNVFMIVRNIRQNSDVFYIETLAEAYVLTSVLSYGKITSQLPPTLISPIGASMHMDLHRSHTASNLLSSPLNPTNSYMPLSL